MFIKKLTVKNYRVFTNLDTFEINDFNIPDEVNEGTGLTLIVGENACGKTSILDALALPVLSYKADEFSLNDFNDPNQKTYVEIYSKEDFDYDGTMPKSKYKGQGFSFTAGIRSKGANSYLSSIVVKDQRYIRADGQVKPEDTSPDLRVSVNNPWKGSRFSENDFLFLDEKRLFQIRSGTYNSTRFDRLMEDLDYKYIKTEGNPTDLVKSVQQHLQGLENSFLEESFKKFKEICGIELSLNHIDNWKPYSKSFIAIQKANLQQVRLDMLGSGYEMVFALLYSFFLAQQSGKQLIILIDEPELHLHPKLQESFVRVLQEFSKTCQIILTTHSPLLVKQAMYNDNVKVMVLKKDIDKIKVSSPSERKLPYLSANEINFIAFGLATEEYHNELYEKLKDTHWTSPNLKDFDLHFFQKSKGEIASFPYNGTSNQVSLHTHLRTQIHHRGNNGVADIQQIEASITKMRSYL